MGSRLLGIIVKEFIHLRRDVLALVLALGVPVAMLGIFGWAINTDVKHVPTAVFEQSGSAEVATSGSEASTITWTSADCRESCRPKSGGITTPTLAAPWSMRRVSSRWLDTQ